MTTRVVDRDPAGLALLVRAALPVVPGLNLLPGVRKRADLELPDLTLERRAVPVARDHVAAYAEVCGFPLRDQVPLTYPHVLAFGLHLAIMTEPEFPFPAVGTVHLENSITRHRHLPAGSRVDLTARPANLRPHPKGRVFDILSEAHTGGELVWAETSTFLRLGGGEPAAASGPELPDAPTGSTSWRLPGDLGRRYAAVSGDHNPIHLYALTAKAFGFRRQIAHGMWSKARCLAALEGRLPEAVRVEVAFKKPILLPGRVVFGSRRVDGGDVHGYDFGLTRPRDGAPHLVGRTTAG